MNLVAIACNVPSGLVLESGDTRVVLNGAKQRILLAGMEPSPKDLLPGATGGVDEAWFDQWCSDHADSNIVTQKRIWKMTPTSVKDTHA